MITPVLLSLVSMVTLTAIGLCILYKDRAHKVWPLAVVSCPDQYRVSNMCLCQCAHIVISQASRATTLLSANHSKHVR